MEHASLSSLVIVVVAAFLTPILLHRFRISFIPVVVAEIIVGLILGQSGFQIVQDDVWLGTLSTLGFLFLMFLSGLEIDFTMFSSQKKPKAAPKKTKNVPNPFSAASIVFIGIFIVSYGLAFGFEAMGLIDDAFLMTLIISTISLGVVVPTLKEAGLMKTVIGQIILLVAVIADLVTMILLAVYVSINSESGGNMWLLLILFATGLLFYAVAKRVKHKPLFTALSTGTVQIGTRAVFTLMIVLVALSEYVGAENILGAFLAGVLVSLLAPNHELIRQLDSFGYGFLIPIFFVMVGVELNIWTLFGDPQLLLLIPLLLLALFISKVVPMLYLRRFYDMKSVIASSFLLTSTLSLVIAAAKIAEELGVITTELSGTFILVAVIACIITPVIFKKMFPFELMKTEKKSNVAFVGATQYSLPVSRELSSDQFNVSVYQGADNEPASPSLFEIVYIDDLAVDSIKSAGLFEKDILLLMTENEELNVQIAIAAKKAGVERVIAHAEREESSRQLEEEGIEVFSSILSAKSLLRAMIESPSVPDFVTNSDVALHEIKLGNRAFAGMRLSDFPFTGDVIFVRIVRGVDLIVPHGDTELKIGDRLIVTGSKEYVEELKQDLR
ncbi:monovalent cation:proton antiporter family protein [Domibacillus epiphyticus]|uniref:Sodium:proton antiporter n=1 Tax=Domibacillus epiphyticus TaxID=1714355 RepID=A0A1V2A8D9_9BACI|nr:monovalent cation:proton antiporter family protein [Domibacillus epiphyticus]OMP67084.1 sodium:proton antiporter [Domibacillus epiphyticus]